MPYLSPPTLTREEQQALLQATAGHPRNHLIFLVALGTGLRLGEESSPICGLPEHAGNARSPPGSAKPGEARAAPGSCSRAERADRDQTRP